MLLVNVLLSLLGWLVAYPRRSHKLGGVLVDAHPRHGRPATGGRRLRGEAHAPGGGLARPSSPTGAHAARLGACTRCGAHSIWTLEDFAVQCAHCVLCAVWCVLTSFVVCAHLICGVCSPHLWRVLTSGSPVLDADGRFVAINFDRQRRGRVLKLPSL